MPVVAMVDRLVAQHSRSLAQNVYTLATSSSSSSSVVLLRFFLNKNNKNWSRWTRTSERLIGVCVHATHRLIASSQWSMCIQLTILGEWFMGTAYTSTAACYYLPIMACTRTDSCVRRMTAFLRLEEKRRTKSISFQLSSGHACVYAHIHMCI